MKSLERFRHLDPAKACKPCKVHNGGGDIQRTTWAQDNLGPGWQPQAMRSTRTHSTCTSCSCRTCLGVGRGGGAMGRTLGCGSSRRVRLAPPPKGARGVGCTRPVWGAEQLLPVPGVGSSPARVAATGHALDPHPPGSHLAHVPYAPVVGGFSAIPWRTARSMRGCSEGLARALHARRGIIVRVRGSHAPCTLPAPDRHAQRAHAEARGCIKGALVCHAAARLSTEPGQIERVCGRRGEGLYVGAMTHPHAPSTLGARVA